MDTKMQLQKHAHVLASNAQEVGFLERVVLNPETNVITHIVVRMGPLFNKEDKIVPIELVTDTTEDLVLLNTDAATVESMPLFEEQQVVSEGRTVEASASSENKQPVPFGESPSVIPLVLDPDDAYATETVQNIPEGTIAMKEGAKVIAADGEHVGHVERIFADPEVDQVTHLLISRGIFSKEVKLIPTKWILKIGEDNVYLNVNKDSVEGLAGIPLTE
jgi:sporulation protein YlmC with PRC-barrel domain